MSWKLLKDKYRDGTLPKITSRRGKLRDTVIKDKDTEKKWIHGGYDNRHMKLYPELHKNDASNYPCHTGLNCLPYYVICRRRIHKTKKLFAQQFNREISHMAMMQSYAIAGMRIDRNFSVGLPSEALIVPDFATRNERRRINQIMSDK